ncbi:MAG: colanic acid biosynthesis glycosyltransferase WcaL, partial [Nitrospirae bacterium]|nr:colanic acid biosynthesis glycosyltransferase WcaL [Nitrospirota bacterium]
AFPEISETFILNQISGLIDRGHHVDIYAMRPGNLTTMHAEVTQYGLLDRTRYLGVIPRNRFVRVLKAVGQLAGSLKHLDRAVIVRSLNARRYGRAASSLSLLFNALPLLRERHYDIIHCQFGTLGPRTLQLRQIGAISGKLIISFRGYDATQYLKDRPGVYAEMFRDADLLLPVSSSLREVLVHAGCPECKIRVHHSGIDCAKFVPAERRRADGDTVKVISVARLVEKKGIAYALEAMAKVKRTGRKIQYTIVGDGPLRSSLEELIGTFGISEDVKLAGWKNHDEVIGLMRESDVLLAPSITTEKGDQEGIPNVIKEAMALCIPVISTYHSGIPELVEHNVSGFLVPEKNVAALSGCLAQVIDAPDVRISVGRNGRKRVETHYDIQKLNDRMVEIYQQLARECAGNYGGEFCSSMPAQ